MGKPGGFLVKIRVAIASENPVFCGRQELMCQ